MKPVHNLKVNNDQSCSSTCKVNSPRLFTLNFRIKKVCEEVKPQQLKTGTKILKVFPPHFLSLCVITLNIFKSVNDIKKTTRKLQLEIICDGVSCCQS